jgi:hypothetical protein
MHAYSALLAPTLTMTISQSTVSSAGSTSDAMSLDLPLEIFGQNDTLSIMTPFIYIYSAPHLEDISPLVRTLESGLERLTATFPWIAGRITNTTRTKSCSGVFKITPHVPVPRLVVQDWRDDRRVPTIQDLIEAKAPCSMLKEEFFAPTTVLPRDGEEGDRSPLLHVQISIINGGVVLALMANHQAIDGTAQDQIAYLLDKACNGIPFTDEEVRIGNLRRETIVEPFPDDWLPPSGSIFSPQPKPEMVEDAGAETKKADTAELRWTEIVFDGPALLALKTEVTKDLSIGFVSTDDILTALVWQGLARARLARLPLKTESTIGRAVNPRKYLGIPATYPGYITNNAYSSDTLFNLAHRPLGDIATELRSAVNPETSGLGESTREFATMLYRAENKNDLSMIGALDLDRDLMLSSWAGFRGYQFDFGMGLGQPVLFRRTDQAMVPSLAFFLPKRDDGEWVLSICLRVDDLECLRRDPVFNKYGRFIS